MPHGGGHHGGGHHGGGHHGGGHHGGGHHGGGFHHHHHHHGGFHHHRPYYGWGWGWGYRGGYGYGYRRRRYGWGLGIGCPIFIVFLILLIAVLSVRYTGDENGGSKTYYAPGDTRFISYSPGFCESLTLKDYSSSTSATLYLLKQKPPLTNRDEFTVEVNEQINGGDYSYWNYFLYAGSNFSMSYCLVVTQPLNFYVIRGENDFSDWEDDPSSSHAQAYFLISNSCSGGPKSFAYNISGSGSEYYFAFDNFGTSPSKIQATLHFERTLYDIHQNDSIVVDFCQAGGKFGRSCTVDVPYDTDYYALVAVDVPQNPNWVENVGIDWECGPRAWVYTIIVLVPLVFIVLCITAVVLVCCYIKYRKRKTYTPLDEPMITPPSEVGSPAVNVTETTPATAPPPPPAEAPPTYGWSGYPPEQPPPNYNTVMKQ